MKPKVLLLTLTFIIAAFWAQARDTNLQATPVKKNDIAGNVVHSQTKKPLGNVSVTAYSAAKKQKVMTTDNNGNFYFNDLEPGTYRFVFQKDGFKKVTKEKITIRPEETFQMTIEMLEAEDYNFIPGTFNFVDF